MIMSRRHCPEDRLEVNFAGETSRTRTQNAPRIAALQVLEELFLVGEANRAVARLARDVDEQRKEGRTGCWLWLQMWFCEGEYVHCMELKVDEPWKIRARHTFCYTM